MMLWDWSGSRLAAGCERSLGQIEWCVGESQGLSEVATFWLNQADEGRVACRDEPANSGAEESQGDVQFGESGGGMLEGGGRWARIPAVRVRSERWRFRAVRAAVKLRE